MPRKHPPQKSSTQWESVAPWYDQLVGETGSEFHQHVVIPGVLRLIDPQPRMTVLDVACGQGVLCRAMQERGAEVSGIDAAESLIESARKRGPEAIHYHVADARDLSFLGPDHFHAVMCVLAIQNIQPIKPVIEGVHRVLRPNGKFVIVMLHPCFRGAKESSWGWDEKMNVQYRRVDRYLMPRKSPIVMHPGSKTREYTWTFHRPLEDYIKAMAMNGLLVDALEEWPSHKTSTSGPKAAAENTARKEIPMFLALRGVKAKA